MFDVLTRSILKFDGTAEQALAIAERSVAEGFNGDAHHWAQVARRIAKTRYHAIVASDTSYLCDEMYPELDEKCRLLLAIASDAEDIAIATSTAVV